MLVVGGSSRASEQPEDVLRAGLLQNHQLLLVSASSLPLAVSFRYYSSATVWRGHAVNLIQQYASKKTKRHGNRLQDNIASTVFQKLPLFTGDLRRN